MQADVSSTQRFSTSSETASAATSSSEKSVSASSADDGAASVRALAGSVSNFKVGFKFFYYISREPARVVERLFKSLLLRAG